MWYHLDVLEPALHLVIVWERNSIRLDDGFDIVIDHDEKPLIQQPSEVVPQVIVPFVMPNIVPPLLDEFVLRVWRNLLFLNIFTVDFYVQIF